MSALFYSLSILLAIFTLTFTSLEGMFINRTFMNLPLYLIEKNVIRFVNDYETYITLHEYCIKNDINVYLSKSLKNYIDSYHIGFYFFTLENGVPKVKEENFNTMVQIHFKCKYAFAKEYENFLTFRVNEVI